MTDLEKIITHFDANTVMCKDKQDLTSLFQSVKTPDVIIHHVTHQRFEGHLSNAQSILAILETNGHYYEITLSYTVQTALLVHMDTIVCWIGKIYKREKEDRVCCSHIFFYPDDEPALEQFLKKFRIACEKYLKGKITQKCVHGIPDNNE